MSRTVTSTLVARRIMKIGERDNKKFTNIHLQKLTFLAHGWSFPLLDNPLVHEPVEAWQYGPVFRDLYGVLKKFGSSTVTDVPKSFSELLAGFIGDSSLSKREKRLIRFVYNEYGDLSAWRLVGLTHKKDSPWYKTKKDEVIERFRIQKYFDNWARQRDGEIPVI